MGSTSLLEVEAVEPLDPRHRDPHAEVVLLLGKVAKVVALVIAWVEILRADIRPARRFSAHVEQNKKLIDYN